MATLFASALLIEDDPAHSLLIERALRPLVGKLDVLRSKAEIASVTFSPDLVVTDLYLPDGKGTEVVEAVVKAFPSAPVMVLTSSSSLDDAVAAMRVGARDFLVKQFDGGFREALPLSLARIFREQALLAEARRSQREAALLREAIDASSDGFAVLDRSGSMLYRNHAFADHVQAWSGQPCGEQFLANSGDCRAIEGGEQFRDRLRQQIRELPIPSVFRAEAITSGDGGRGFEVTLTAVSYEEATAIVARVRDVTDLRRREQFQRDLLSATTHDLKGPLGTIALSASMLQERVRDDAKSAELALRVSSSTQNALNLIDEFLSARRIEEGRFILRPSPHPVAQIVEESLMNYTAIAAARRITLTAEVAPGEGMVTVDRLGVERVLGNLLSNALKFTGSGGKVVLRVTGDERGTAFAVKDTGSGMEPAEVRKLFERFQRLDRHGEVPGTGLGLFVVRSVVAAHGGTVEVESQPGKGSTFRVWFPTTPPINERGELVAI